jgi:CBS domain containing-hemolysin-like protein
MALPGQQDAWDVDGRAPMEVLRSLGVRFDEAEATEPLGAVVLSHLGRLARPGDCVSIGENATAEVVRVLRRRVERVRVRLAAAPEDAG